jgi:predicted transcriptional regulator of viral defense system
MAGMDDMFGATISRRRLPDLGLTRNALDGLVRSGEWSRLRRGEYQIGSPLLRPEDQHLLRIRATVGLAATAQFVVSHISAAVLWGLPTWGVDLSRVHLTRPGRSGCATTAEVIPHRAMLTDDEIAVIDGIAVTSLARTVLDVARYHGFERGVVVADAALRAGLDRRELHDVLEAARSRGSAGCAGQVIAFADPLAESVGESRSRVRLWAFGLPKPELQHRFYSPTGQRIGRVDFWIEEFATVGEFDGMTKYGLPANAPVERIVEEKSREDAIRDLGQQVVRWMDVDLGRPAVIMDRFARAFARSGHRDWVPRPRSVLLAGGWSRRQARTARA